VLRVEFVPEVVDLVAQEGPDVLALEGVEDAEGPLLRLRHSQLREQTLQTQVPPERELKHCRSLLFVPQVGQEALTDVVPDLFEHERGLR